MKSNNNEFKKASDKYNQTDFLGVGRGIDRLQVLPTFFPPLIVYIIAYVINIYLLIAIYLISLIIIYRKVSKIKTNPADVPDVKGREWIALRIGFAPLFAQLIFNLLLGKTHPKSAKIYTNFAIKILLFQLVLFGGLALLVILDNTGVINVQTG